MEPTEPLPYHRHPRGRLRSGIIAAGAALAMTLAGLGIAGAQVDDATSDPSPPTAPEGADPGGAAGGNEHGASPAGRERHCHRKHPGVAVAVAARTIGISEADLVKALRAGQSMAQVAQSKGVEVQKVVDALVAEGKARLEARVASGALSQAQADEKSAELADRARRVVNRAGSPGSGRGAAGHRTRIGAASSPPAVES